MPGLFDPLKLGPLDLPNRIVMAPMTRGRATREHVPTAMMGEYYAQRACCGLIISEATGISRQGLGWPYAPGLWTREQVEGWKPVTQRVHDAGGLIIAQLWHMGRMVHPDLGGGQPVSSSATTAPGEAWTYDGRKPYVEARPLRVDEIPGVVADYASAAANAMEAGFDGVQIHAANGYLLDQFLRDSANLREDEYGGSVENRIRLTCEVTQAVVDAIGAERTGVRFSPNGEVQGVRDSDPLPLFTAATKALNAIGIAHLELKEPPFGSSYGDAYIEPLAPQLREHFDGVLILNSDYDRARAEVALAAGTGDAISFGRPFIANPDLPRRMKEGLPLTETDRAAWLGRAAMWWRATPVFLRMAEPIELHSYKSGWVDSYRMVMSRLREVLPSTAAIHHIGSTAVDGLRAKNIIDVQVTIAALGDIDIDEMEAHGFHYRPGLNDHCPEGMALGAFELEKRYFNLSDPDANIHVRERGRFNQRFALLSRDYLRANSGAAKAYETIKAELSGRFPRDIELYYAIKDPVFDLIYAAAEQWADAVGWGEPESD